MKSSSRSGLGGLGAAGKIFLKARIRRMFVDFRFGKEKRESESRMSGYPELSLGPQNGDRNQNWLYNLCCLEVPGVGMEMRKSYITLTVSGSPKQG